LTTSTTSSASNDPATRPGLFLLPWINRGLEGLWLLMVFLIPLAFLDKNYVISEAEIANVEVPKVALLRLLAGLTALLWLSEWAIQSSRFENGFPSISSSAFVDLIDPKNRAAALRRWLNVHPTRWLLLSAILFFGSALITTLLSGALKTSLWGEVPGQDGYSAYTIASYGVLFSVIATHLRTQAQLGRLIGAVVLMGTLVGLYGILQHYNHDFLELSETTGGKVTMFMGNRIFAGAVLSMTVPATLVAAALQLSNDRLRNWGPLTRLAQWHRDTVFATLWAVILAIQLMGLMFTLSRGPWGGAVLALAAFLGLVALSLGLRAVLRTGLVLGLAGVFAASFLQWQGSVFFVDVGSGFGLLVALVGIAGASAILYLIQRFGRAVVFVTVAGALIVAVGGSVLAPSVLSGRGAAEPTADTSAPSAGSEIGGRISSIKTDVLGGFVGGRSTHWEISWDLMKERPWFESHDLSLRWLRPLIGYGPDLFRFTYLLRSPAEGPEAFPLEPDHAHNFFIHQSVEQGILGGVASLAIFISAFGVVVHQLVRRRNSGHPVYRLLLLGMAAILLGRFLEMMVGVARISDLTVLWVIFALFAAAPGFDDHDQQETDSPQTEPATAAPAGRRARRRAARAAVASSFSTGLLVRLAILAWIVGGLGVITWQKSINSVRASVAEGQALEHFLDGDLESAVVDLDKAINLAPGVPTYYNNRAQLYFLYRLRPDIYTDPFCANQTEFPYLTCLGLESLESSFDSIEEQPFYYRSQIASGNAAFNMNAHESAIESYGTAVGLAPSSWKVRNDLAESQIALGMYEDALEQLDLSITTTGQTANAVQAMNFKGVALQKLDRLDESSSVLRQAISLGHKQSTLDLLRDVNFDLGVALDVDYYNRLIERSPDDSAAMYFRGLAHFVQGNHQLAVQDFNSSLSLGLNRNEIRAHLAYSSFKSGAADNLDIQFQTTVAVEPVNPIFVAYFGEFRLSVGQHDQALILLDRADSLSKEFGLSQLVRARVFNDLGLEDHAVDVLGYSAGSDLPTADHYAERGILHAYYGQGESAFADLNRAIALNPERAEFYGDRAKIHVNQNDPGSALNDLNAAIALDPSSPEYRVNRGVLRWMAGQPAESQADFDIAQALGEDEIPPVEIRDISYFSYFKPFRFLLNEPFTTGRAEYSDDIPTEAKARRQLWGQKFESDRMNTEHYAAIGQEDEDYVFALETLESVYLATKDWAKSADASTKLIGLSPNDPARYRDRGRAYAALNRPEDAINDLSRAVLLGADDARNYVGRAAVYAQAEDYAAALADLETAIRLDSNFVGALSLRGYLSVLTGETVSGFEDLDQAIELSPFSHDAYFKRALAHVADGRLSQALEDMDRAIAWAPIDYEYLHQRGKVRFDLEEYEGALADFESSIGISGEPGPIYPLHADSFLDSGRTQMMLGDSDAAAEAARSSIAVIEAGSTSPEWEFFQSTINDRLADAHQLLGDILTRSGDNAEAEKEYRTARSLR